MNKSNLFKLAHILTKAIIKTGDNYQVTFGAAVKHINTTHQVKGTDKQVAWANEIIANIIASIKNTQSDMIANLANRRAEANAMPLLIKKLKRVVAHYTAQCISMSLSQLFSTVKNKSYKMMQQDLRTMMVEDIFKSIRRTESKKQIKLLK